VLLAVAAEAEKVDAEPEEEGEEGGREDEDEVLAVVVVKSVRTGLFSGQDHRFQGQTCWQMSHP
jgi:hypothetical protein